MHDQTQGFLQETSKKSDNVLFLVRDGFVSATLHQNRKGHEIQISPDSTLMIEYSPATGRCINHTATLTRDVIINIFIYFNIYSILVLLADIQYDFFCTGSFKIKGFN